MLFLLASYHFKFTTSCTLQHNLFITYLLFINSISNKFRETSYLFAYGSTDNKNHSKTKYNLSICILLDIFKRFFVQVKVYVVALYKQYFSLVKERIKCNCFKIANMQYYSSLFRCMESCQNKF